MLYSMETQGLIHFGLHPEDLTDYKSLVLRTCFHIVWAFHCAFVKASMSILISL